MYKKRLMELGIKPNHKGMEYLNLAFELYTPFKTMGMILNEISNAIGGKKPKTIHKGIDRAIKQSGDAIGVFKFISKYKILWGDE